MIFHPTVGTDARLVSRHGNLHGQHRQCAGAYASGLTERHDVPILFYSDLATVRGMVLRTSEGLCRKHHGKSRRQNGGGTSTKKSKTTSDQCRNAVKEGVSFDFSCPYAKLGDLNCDFAQNFLSGGHAGGGPA